MAGKGAKPEAPREPGWYPDPWSATGEGERYFDGKRWGTTEKPLARLSAPEPAATRITTRSRLQRARPWIAGLVLLAAAIAITEYQSSSGSDDPPSPRQQAVSAGIAPPSSREEADHPLGRPAAVPAGSGGYELLQHQPGGADAPVAFDPCRPVHYVVNPAGEPLDGQELVRSAIARLHTATGLEFVADGATAESPAKDRQPYQPGRYRRARWAPVLIAWSDEQSFPLLAGYVAGVGSAQPVPTDSGALAYVTGQVVLDRQQLDPAVLPDRAEARAILLHELGHVVGLDHTSDATQLMYSEAQFNVQNYGDGDLRGLARLGTQRCYPEL
jgi:hypothetical protein